MPLDKKKQYPESKKKYRELHRDEINARERARYHANLEESRRKHREKMRRRNANGERRQYNKAWQDHFGVKIPEGFVIHHKDGDIKNNVPNNLLCLPRDEHARLHWIRGDILKKAEA